MDSKLLALQRPDQCARCGVRLPAGAEVWWDKVARQAECTACHPVDPVDGVDDAPRLPPVLAPPTDPARASREAVDELSAQFRRAVGETGVVIDDRRVPGRKVNIDHIVIAPSGVWVIDVKPYRTTVERRSVGRLLARSPRLFVGGFDKTQLVDAMGWQVTEVRSALEKAAMPKVPVHPVLCFTSAEWGLFARPFQINGVWVGPSRKVVDLISAAESTPHYAIETIATALMNALPSAR